MKLGYLAAASLLPLASAATAQVVERNLPPAPAGAGVPLAPPNVQIAQADPTPIGPALEALVLLGPDDAVVGAAQPGVDAGRIEALRGEGIEMRLARFLGRQISGRLIAEIEAEIAQFYRRQGRPFVALSTPEQEITAGVLQLRVVEFTAGTIVVEGASRTPEDWYRDRVRQSEGAPIDAKRLSRDLDWIERAPFVDVGAVFSPGDRTGRSNLALAATELKPWQVYAGYANSGSSSTDRDRVYAGIQAAPFAGSPDTVISYQFTGSGDLFDGGDTSYRSHAAILSVGIAPRQALELTLDRIATNQDTEVFGVHQTISEAVLGWRGAVGDFGDLRFGVEARRGHRTIAFGGIDVAEARADIVQLYGGVDIAGRDRTGETFGSLSVHFSPGGFTSRNDGADLLAYSDGRVGDAQYAYFRFDFVRSTQIGAARVENRIRAQLATDPLPDTEQFAIGGATSVRGYSLDDGAFDSGLVLRNTIYGPVVGGTGAVRVQPYVLADFGFAREKGTGAHSSAVSAGAGVALRLSRVISADASFACALQSAAFTDGGDCRALVRVTASY